MDNPLIDQIDRTFSLELPSKETLDSYLDLVLPQVRPHGEDLRETKYYSTASGKAWLEIRDDAEFQEAVLHYFNEGGEYLQSVNGNISRGKWRLLENKIIIETGQVSELYELAYLNNIFFILKKHGNHRSRKKYFVMGFEPAVRNLKWKDYVESIYNQYRSQWSTFHWMVLFAILLMAAVIAFSLI